MDEVIVSAPKIEVPLNTTGVGMGVPWGVVVPGMGHSVNAGLNVKF